MLVFTNFETMDHLREDCRATTARLQATRADMVRLLTGGAEEDRRDSEA
ncbi:hypothetical protein [Streptomyces carpinensis]|uniref:Uncharacterized protein n=1 Tax=Streptomyces carpinensis TaxID=66369 RepID=A0ABV1VY94_9ACTN|nr:hypothetical protein [Streptomyces carpinensis]